MTHPIYIYIEGVPLPTETAISLIILPPMKILQRNLNRSTFVELEMKSNVSVVCAVVQDGATSHTSHASMAEISPFFGDRLISKGSLATALARSEAALLLLMGISERENLQKQTKEP